MDDDNIIKFKEKIKLKKGKFKSNNTLSFNTPKNSLNSYRLLSLKRRENFERNLYDSKSINTNNINKILENKKTKSKKTTSSAKAKKIDIDDYNKKLQVKNFKKIIEDKYLYNVIVNNKLEKFLASSSFNLLHMPNFSNIKKSAKKNSFLYKATINCKLLSKNNAVNDNSKNNIYTVNSKDEGSQTNNNNNSNFSHNIVNISDIDNEQINEEPYIKFMPDNSNNNYSPNKSISLSHRSSAYSIIKYNNNRFIKKNNNNKSILSANNSNRLHELNLNKSLPNNYANKEKMINKSNNLHKFEKLDEYSKNINKFLNSSMLKFHPHTGKNYNFKDKKLNKCKSMKNKIKNKDHFYYNKNLSDILCINQVKTIKSGTKIIYENFEPNNIVEKNNLVNNKDEILFKNDLENKIKILNNNQNNNNNTINVFSNPILNRFYNANIFCNVVSNSPSKKKKRSLSNGL